AVHEIEEVPRIIGRGDGVEIAAVPDDDRRGEEFAEGAGQFLERDELPVHIVDDGLLLFLDLLAREKSRLELVVLLPLAPREFFRVRKPEFLEKDEYAVAAKILGRDLDRGEPRLSIHLESGVFDYE